MTTNPLQIRRQERPQAVAGPAYGTQEWCDWRNQTMTRTDIEWVLDGRGGAYLRDVPAASAARTRELQANAERDRRDYNHRQRYPVTAVVAEA